MAFNLNLPEYQPYKRMGQTCQLKDIMEFHINWPKLVTASTLTNRDLIMRYMRSDDIDRVVELWKNVYPEAYGSTHQIVFDVLILCQQQCQCLYLNSRCLNLFFER